MSETEKKINYSMHTSDRKVIGKRKFNGVSMILPALNEAENLFRVGSQIMSYCEAFQSFEFELIIVDDGSHDSTNAEMKRLQEKYPNHIVTIFNARNRGYGFAIRQGIIRSRYDLIFFTDADGQFDIRDLDLLVPLIESGVPDVVIGYRIDRKDAWIRLFLSGCYNVLVRLMFGINVKDVDCAFKLFNKRIFEKIEIRSKNFFINTEILAKAVFFNFRIVEIGVDHLPRTAGKSTVNFRHVPLTLRELTRIWFQMRKLKQEKGNHA